MSQFTVLLGNRIVCHARVVSSTMGGALEEAEEVLKRRSPIGVTDCRSLRDHLVTLGQGGVLGDKRTAIDIAIIKQSTQRSGLEPRWVPTTHMLADGLTKDKADPIDLLRSVLTSARYQLADKQAVLDRKKSERERRRQLSCIQANKEQSLKTHDQLR